MFCHAYITLLNNFCKNVISLRRLDASQPGKPQPDLWLRTSRWGAYIMFSQQSKCGCMSPSGARPSGLRLGGNPLRTIVPASCATELHMEPKTIKSVYQEWHERCVNPIIT